MFHCSGLFHLPNLIWTPPEQTQLRPCTNHTPCTHNTNNPSTTETPAERLVWCDAVQFLMLVHLENCREYYSLFLLYWTQSKQLIGLYWFIVSSLVYNDYAAAWLAVSVLLVFHWQKEFSCTETVVECTRVFGAREYKLLRTHTHTGVILIAPRETTRWSV